MIIVLEQIKIYSYKCNIDITIYNDAYPDTNFSAGYIYLDVAQ